MSPKKLTGVPLIPIRDVVVFPQTMFPFVVGRSSSVEALEVALKSDRHIFLATQKDPSIDIPSPEQIYEVGTLTLLIQNLKLPEGNIKVLVEGIRRGKIVSINQEKNYYTVDVELYDEIPISSEREQSLRDEMMNVFEEYVKFNPGFNLDAALRALKQSDLSKIADNISNNLPVGIQEKQELLEIVDPHDRLTKIIQIVGFEIEKVKIDKSVQGQVKDQMEKAQRDYYLHEKMKAIKKELGEEQTANELEELKKKVEESGMHKDAMEKSLKEIKRLEMMPPMSAETTVSRNYLDWLLSLPWKKKSRENRNLKKAERILEEDHYGLEKIKERILEFLAVRQMSRKSQGSILCFGGPPGVGKTSLGRSIARATGRKFIRMSLGGVRDEAEIRGHRRTYIGAFPGQIIQLIKKAGTRNPVFMLDEIDKMSVDFRGDPSAAFLEVLDPEQNLHYVDHFIDTEFDLSQVMFIGTANTLHTIQRTLQDRMEVLELSGYTEKEKLEIAKRYLLHKRRDACGLKPKQIVFTDDALIGIIRHYTRESGVRNLEREIGRVCRKVVRQLLVSKKKRKMTISGENLSDFLGPIKYRTQKTETRNEVGLATGMAWTEVGGEVLFTEVTKMPGTGKLLLTGKLGEVMQESAQAALSYVRTRLEYFGLEADFSKKIDIHVHVPEGAIPKDGPSAGITIATAIVSTCTGIAVKRSVAMTGEITLRGKVLPIGGLKEKVLAAHRAGIDHVILPFENKKDLEDIPAEVQDELTIHFVQTMDEVLAIALEKLPVAMKALGKKLPGTLEGNIEEGRVTN